MRYYIIVKESIINIYALKIGAPEHIKQILKNMKKEFVSNTIIVETITPYLHQRIGHPDRKSTRKHGFE